MDQSVTLFRELILAVEAVDIEDLRRGSLQAIFELKHDRDLLAWYLSLPLDSSCDQETIEIRNRGRKVCMELAPCLEMALRAKTLESAALDLTESLECLMLRYGQLVVALRDLTRKTNPGLEPLLNVCIT